MALTLDRRLSRRQVEAFAPYLGSIVTCEGRIAEIHYTDRLTKSINELRHRLILLVDCRIMDIDVDHLWIKAIVKFGRLEIGDWLTFTGKLTTYVDSRGEKKVQVVFPFRNVEVLRETFPDDFPKGLTLPSGPPRELRKKSSREL